MSVKPPKGRPQEGEEYRIVIEPNAEKIGERYIGELFSRCRWGVYRWIDHGSGDAARGKWSCIDIGGASSPEKAEIKAKKAIAATLRAKAAKEAKESHRLAGRTEISLREIGRT